jgi:serine/threonine protein kinase
MQLRPGEQLVAKIADFVRQAFPSMMRSILTDIYLCRTCSCQEILRMETPGQGISRDKAQDSANQTAMMTGIGSVLWMAPEILLGNTYNEKVQPPRAVVIDPRQRLAS